MTTPELDKTAEMLPERDPKGRFFWQEYVDRIADCFDGLPAPDGSESFVGGCLAAGCKAVPVIERNVLWKNRAPPESERRARAVFEFRVRLGLFFAASLRYLAHGACRLRVKSGDREWHPLTGAEASFAAFQAAQGGNVEIAWSETAPRFGEVCLGALFFFQRQEVLLVSPALAGEVLSFLDPKRAAGLFGRMLLRDGQVETAAADVAGVFLEALVEAVGSNVLRVNTRANGHLFVTPAFWFLTTPVGLDCVTEAIRGRSPRHDFTRHDVFRALREAGCLVRTGGDATGSDTPRCVLRCGSWSGPLELHGLCIAPGALPGQPVVPPFDGTVTLMEEIVDGSDTL
ncbi:MAG: hypothetical protein OXP66_13185 [Candidatus Tectomicrobia bacterium]|nr:hypothetical protein [Candidatus Tectomicrobia bacterium]